MSILVNEKNLIDEERIAKGFVEAVDEAALKLAPALQKALEDALEGLTITITVTKRVQV